MLRVSAPRWSGVLRGLGGIGKTALAHRINRRFILEEKAYSNFAWVSARQQFLDRNHAQLGYVAIGKLDREGFGAKAAAFARRTRAGDEEACDVVVPYCAFIFVGILVAVGRAVRIFLETRFEARNDSRVAFRTPATPFLRRAPTFHVARAEQKGLPSFF